MANYGRDLFWRGAVQGVVELVDRERCKDDWWNEVVDELRCGQLSDANWRYLHGYEVEGCQLSAEERASRRRVITGPRDERLQMERFRDAVVVVSNNDARYQINKDRARCYSEAAQTPLRWAVAIDRASTAALQAEACDKEAKIRRAQVRTSAAMFTLGRSCCRNMFSLGSIYPHTGPTWCKILNRRRLDFFLSIYHTFFRKSRSCICLIAGGYNTTIETQPTFVAHCRWLWACA